jgi:nucleolar protein 56
LPFVPCSQLGEARPRADLIPVEKIRGPILLVAGDDDLAWPAGSYARALADRLRARGKRDFSSLVYSGAGHAIVAAFPYLPLPTLSEIGGSAAGGDPQSDARGRTHSWRQLLRLLERLR